MEPLPKNKSAVAHLNQNECPYAYISKPMGVKENPSIAELMCYFCNLSLDLQTRAPEPRNHQKEKKTGAALLCCQRKADQLLWIQ